MFIFDGKVMELILFIYGLSFFTLGVSVLFSQSKESEYFYANKIWLLGSFAIVHAFEDWMGLFTYIHPDSKLPMLSYIQSFLLLLSYIFLFEFSRFIIRKGFKTAKSQKHIIYKIYYPPFIYTLATLSLAYLIFLYPSTSGIRAAIRYTFGLWGILLLGGGLYHYGDSLNRSQNTAKLKLYFKISGIAFVFYGIFSGIIVDKTTYFPGNIINTESFLDTIHLPVQLFRAICAIIVATTSIKSLKIFKYELVNKLNKSYKKIENFTSNASHQIKTPLTAIRLQIYLALKKHKEIQEYKETLLSIDKEISFLQEMIKNLLLLTRIQDMNLRKKFTTVEIDTVLLEVFEELSIIAKNKGVVLDISKMDSLEVKGEPTLLKILISNLIDNAIKFTPKDKKITISLSKKELMIQDEGIGIAEDQLSKIFDKFYRATTPGKENTPGYGLGLSMVKQIAQIHRAKINIESKPQNGTKISILF